MDEFGRYPALVGVANMCQYSMYIYMYIYIYICIYIHTYTFFCRFFVRSFSKRRRIPKGINRIGGPLQLANAHPLMFCWKGSRCFVVKKPVELWRSRVIPAYSLSSYNSFSGFLRLVFFINKTSDVGTYFARGCHLFRKARLVCCRVGWQCWGTTGTGHHGSFWKLDELRPEKEDSDVFGDFLY